MSKSGYRLWALADISEYVCHYGIDGEKEKKGPPIGFDGPSACDENRFVVL